MNEDSKEKQKEVYPIALERDGDDRLLIRWSDGEELRIRWGALRTSCPCASCRDERSKPKPLLPVIKPEEAVDPLPTSITPIGRYAYQIDWNDGHNTGIYTFELLRRLGEPE